MVVVVVVVVLTNTGLYRIWCRLPPAPHQQPGKGQKSSPKPANQRESSANRGAIAETPQGDVVVEVKLGSSCSSSSK